jgi:hypothetical protein
MPVMAELASHAAAAEAIAAMHARMLRILVMVFPLVCLWIMAEHR